MKICSLTPGLFFTDFFTFPALLFFSMIKFVVLTLLGTFFLLNPAQATTGGSISAGDNDESTGNNAALIVMTLGDELSGELPDSNRAEPFFLKSNLPENHHRSIVDRLVDDGFKLRSSEDNGSSKIEVEIDPVFSLERFSRTEAARNLEMYYSIHFIDTEDTIIDNQRGSVTVSDTIRYQNRDDLVTDWPVTRFTDVNDTSRWRWISSAAEPVALIGATAVAVVLLYNVRSD